MKKINIILVCMIIVASLFLSPCVSADWSMFRSDPARSGVGTYSSTGSSVLMPTLLWKTNIEWNLTEWDIWPSIGPDLQYKSRSWTEPAVVDNVVYVGVKPRISWNFKSGLWSIEKIEFYAFNVTDGTEIWNYKDASSKRVTPPAVVNGMVYFGTEKYTCALNSSDGSLLWKYPVGPIGTISSYPAVTNGMVYLGDDELRAINAINGHSVWNFTNDDGLFLSPAVANGIVYVGSSDGNIYAVDADTGDKIWDFRAGDFPSPTVANGVVYAMASSNNIYALDAISGTKIWNNSIQHSWVGPTGRNFAIGNNIIYSYSADNELNAFNSIDGTKIWNYAFEKKRVISSAPTVVKDIVYVNSNYSVYALTAQNGEMLWTYTMNDKVSSPVIVNSVAYVSSGDQFFAIAVPTPSLQEPFPTTLVISSLVILSIIVIGILAYSRSTRGKHR